MKKTRLDEVIGVPAGAAPVYLDMLGGANASQAIENQERQGQLDACRVQRLPIKGTSGIQNVWEKLGFGFGEPADDLFVNVTMPEGWSMQPTSHAMWSHLCDEQGRVRAKMFYKAAFYDRDAHISLCRRFVVNQYDNQAGEPDSLLRVSVYDNGALRKEPVHVIETECNNPKERYDVREELDNEAKEWLNETYPEWKDPLAYW